MTMVLKSNFLLLFSTLSKDFEQRVVNAVHNKGHQRIRPAHAALFSFLGNDTLRLTDLAERAGITQQAMGKLVKELEQWGYLLRKIDPTDKRAKMIAASHTGLQLVNDLNQAMLDVTMAYQQVLGDEETQQLSLQLMETVNKLGIHFPKLAKDIA
jgi:DNA-binding MarR family transcriptional regulator